MVLTLLEISFSNISNLDHQAVYIDKVYGNESVYHDIYDRVVRNTRKKIKSYLKYKNIKIMMRCIYILRTEGMTELTNKVLGPLQDYKGTLFQLSAVNGVATFIESNSINEILLDIMDMTDMTLPYNHSYRDKVYDKLVVIANCRDNNLPVDIMMVIDCYMDFGKFLYPYIIEL